MPHLTVVLVNNLSNCLPLMFFNIVSDLITILPLLNLDLSGQVFKAIDADYQTPVWFHFEELFSFVAHYMQIVN